MWVTFVPHSNIWRFHLFDFLWYTTHIGCRSGIIHCITYEAIFNDHFCFHGQPSSSVSFIATNFKFSSTLLCCAVVIVTSTHSLSNAHECVDDCDAPANIKSLAFSLFNQLFESEQKILLYFRPIIIFALIRQVCQRWIHIYYFRLWRLAETLYGIRIRHFVFMDQERNKEEEEESCGCSRRMEKFGRHFFYLLCRFDFELYFMF